MTLRSHLQARLEYRIKKEVSNRIHLNEKMNREDLKITV